MHRYVQAIPPPADPYAGDALLRSWLDRLLGADRHAAEKDRLAGIAADVVGPLREAHADAEAHPPILQRYDAWGARFDRIETAAGWETLRAAAARHGLVALPYLAESRRRWGAAARVLQHALLHLYSPESATFSCPVAMADGAAALLSRPDVDPAVRDAWLPRLLATDPEVAITSGQWMTEAQGGSDLARCTSTGRPAADGSWRLGGEKWFCSAADSAMAVVLARPEGADTGSRVLAPYLVPRYAADSPLAPARSDPQWPAPGVRVHRLKDKLGTRALPTAEIGLRDAYAWPLGDPAEPGLARTMTLVTVARLHNAAASAAGMRRGLSYARAYAAARHVAGGRLDASPLHRATLGLLALDGAAAFALAGHAFALLGRVETGAGAPMAAAATELRIAAPLAKLATAKLAVAAASEYLECFGGPGYVEDTGVPRLLRDAQVLPIWEGTTNVLSLDVLRALARERAGEPLMARLNAAVQLAPPGLADALADEVTEIGEAIGAVVADPYATRIIAGARRFALRLAYALAAALLVEHAAWGDEATAVAADLWVRRRLAGGDVSTDAHEQLDALA